MAFVNCKLCGAEVSDDRKTCPHCQTPVITAASVAIQQAADDKERGYIKQIVSLDQQITHLTAENKRLMEENENLRAANLKAAKEASPAVPSVVEKSGPGVVAENPVTV